MSAVVLLLQETHVDVTKGRAEVTASVTNSGTVPARIVLGAFPPVGGAGQANAVGWTTVDEPLREIAAGATEQYTISIAPPAGTAAGRFPVRFIAYSADSAPEESADQARQLDAVIAAGGAAAVPSKPQWWIYAVAALLVLIVGVVAFQLIPRPTPVATPTPTPVVSPPSSAPTFGPVQVFSLPDYKTESGGAPAPTQDLPIGKYDDVDNQLDKVGNDAIASLKVPQGLAVRAYEHAWYQGEYIDFIEDTPAMPMAWKNKVSSVIVYKASERPPKIDYAVGLDYPWARWLILKAGDYPDLARTPLGADTLTTLLVPQGVTVTLFEDANFQGASFEVTSDRLDLTVDGWTDRAGSLKVTVT